MKLHIADNLLLPTEAVTQTFALLARPAAGPAARSSRSEL
jgi:hypothetical protein